MNEVAEVVDRGERPVTFVRARPLGGDAAEQRREYSGGSVEDLDRFRQFEVHGSWLSV
jgi:hypothetical protein